ncbi:MAG: hypothetical protein IT332_10330 [Ardenticatenales bacterium]|nr:hypothetical protein [Ardenticatenales bacterium]
MMRRPRTGRAITNVVHAGIVIAAALVAAAWTGARADAAPADAIAKFANVAHSADSADSASIADITAADQAVRPQAWLPIGLHGGDFGPPPVAVTLTPSPTATASPNLTGTATNDAPTSTPTTAATPTATPRSGYSEPLTDRPSLDDLKTGYSAARWYETMLEILRRRYPTGHHIVTQLDDSKGKATLWTSGRTGTFDDLVRSMELAVHEMNHQLGFQEGFIPTIGKKHFYEVRADLRVTVDVVPTYARSEIAQFITGPLENQYKSTYLTGQSGTQGFFNLLDEFNAYTHSMFTGYGLHDLFPPNQRVSHRDGLVTMMLYVELYLRQARTKHPADYAALRADPAVRDLVKLLWDRANFILDETEDIRGLALNAAAVEAEMRKAELWGEVERYVAP